MLINVQHIDEVDGLIIIAIGKKHVALKKEDLDAATFNEEKFHYDGLRHLAVKHIRKALLCLEQQGEVGQNAHPDTWPARPQGQPQGQPPTQAAPSPQGGAEGALQPQGEPFPAPKPTPVRAPPASLPDAQNDPMLSSIQEKLKQAQDLPVRVNDPSTVDGNALTSERVSVLVSAWERGSNQIKSAIERRLSEIPPGERMKFVSKFPVEMRVAIGTLANSKDMSKTNYMTAEESSFIEGVPEDLGNLSNQISLKTRNADIEPDTDAEMIAAKKLFEARGMDTSLLDDLNKNAKK